jgi:hypothetical protein
MYGFRDWSGFGSLTSDLAGAIQRMEGACSGPTSCVNNNPGNLRAYAPGQPVDSRGFRIFPDYPSGEAALEGQIDTNIGRGLSLSEFFGGKPGVYSGYAPASDSNNPSGYAATVGGWLGIDPSLPLSAVSGSDSPGFPVDAGGMDPFGGSGSGDGAGISVVAMAGLVLAGLGIVWAVSS